MSRYIDADALKEELQAWAVNLKNPRMLVKSDAEYIIDSAPTIDAVSVVRCKECKSWKWIEWAKEHRCILRNTAFNARADDFCSYGERSEE